MVNGKSVLLLVAADLVPLWRSPSAPNTAITHYKSAGIPRIRRTVQRYCSNGTLEAHRFAVPYGEKYLITPESLDRHIRYVLEARSATADHGQPRLDTPVVAPEKSDEVGLQPSDDIQKSTMVDH